MFRLNYVNVLDESELNKIKCYLTLAEIVNYIVVVIGRGKYKQVIRQERSEDGDGENKLIVDSN